MAGHERGRRPCVRLPSDAPQRIGTERCAHDGACLRRGPGSALFSCAAARGRRARRAFSLAAHAAFRTAGAGRASASCGGHGAAPCALVRHASLLRALRRARASFVQGTGAGVPRLRRSDLSGDCALHSGGGHERRQAASYPLRAARSHAPRARGGIPWK